MDRLDQVQHLAPLWRSVAARGAYRAATADPMRPTPAGPPADAVAVSDAARWMSRLDAVPDVRRDLVDRVRGEIESDSYLTHDKIDTAIERLMEDLSDERFVAVH